MAVPHISLPRSPVFSIALWPAPGLLALALLLAPDRPAHADLPTKPTPASVAGTASGNAGDTLAIHGEIHGEIQASASAS